MNAQTAAALDRANAVRLQRTARKREIEVLSMDEGARVVAGILEHPPPDYLASLGVAALLLWIYRVGPSAARTCTSRLGLPELKRLDTLTVRQRESLRAVLLHWISVRGRGLPDAASYVARGRHLV